MMGNYPGLVVAAVVCRTEEEESAVLHGPAPPPPATGGTSPADHFACSPKTRLLYRARAAPDPLVGRGKYREAPECVG